MPPKMVLPRAFRESDFIKPSVQGQFLASSAPAKGGFLGTATPTTGGAESPRSDQSAEEAEEYPAEYELQAQEAEPKGEEDGMELQFEFCLDDPDDLDGDLAGGADAMDDFVTAEVPIPSSGGFVGSFGGPSSYAGPGSWAPSSFQDRVGSMPGDHGFGASPSLASCLAGMVASPDRRVSASLPAHTR